MSNVLFFDTETTGLFGKGGDPRLVQLAWELYQEDGTLLGSDNYIIYPDGFEIPYFIAQIHGITTARAKREGRDLRKVLEVFAGDANDCVELVAHNMAFDGKMIGSEFTKMGMHVELGMTLMGKKRTCTMTHSRITEFCALPRKGGGYKVPKLHELHQALFGCKFENAHDASADVAATAKCFWALRNKGLI
jgi:DNA polymerase III epsilon subunit-like protein